MQQFGVSSLLLFGGESTFYSFAVGCNCLLITIKPHPDLASGRATHYRKRFDVMDHNSPGGDDGPRAYSYPRKYYCTEPYPNIVPDLDAVFRRFGKRRVSSDPSAVCYEDSRRLIIVV